MEQYESRTRLYSNETSENLLCYVICNSGHKSMYIADFTMSFFSFNGSKQRYRDSSFIKCYPQMQVLSNIMYLTCYKCVLLLLSKKIFLYWEVRKINFWVLG